MARPVEIKKYYVKRLLDGRYYGANEHCDVTDYYYDIDSVIDSIDLGIYNSITNLGMTNTLSYKPYKRPRNNVYGTLTVKIYDL